MENVTYQTSISCFPSLCVRNSFETTPRIIDTCIHISPLQDITPSNKADLLAFRQDYVNSLPEYIYRYAPCSAVHPTSPTCASASLDRFFAVVKWMLPIYGVIRFVPPILFGWKNFLRSPSAVIIKAGLGSMRSSAHLGAFFIIYQSMSLRL